MDDKLINVVLQAIEQKVFPCCVVGIYTKDRGSYVLPFGRLTYDQNSQIATKDSIFDVASVTKSIPTASLALKLIDEGNLHSEDKLVKYIPEFRNSDRELVQIKHLFTHTLEFEFRMSSLKDKTPKDILNTILTHEFKSIPGSKYVYSNASSMLLGMVIERITGKKLDNLADEVFFKPMGMKRTTFHPEKFPKPEIVPTEFDLWRGRLVQGEIHDESAFALRPDFIAGSAGLFSTAGDLLIFLQMVINGGVLKGKRYLSKEIIDVACKNQISELGECTGLGWDLNQKSYMGNLSSNKTIGKTGFTGTSVICDIKKGVGVVILSNFVYPERKQVYAPLRKIRADLADIVFKNN